MMLHMSMQPVLAIIAGILILVMPRLLNYILGEMTVAPPQVKDWSLVVRVHHRSGVFGLFDGVEGGSNVIGAGVKFHY